MSEGMRAKLVCWSCGASKDVVIPHEPQFAFEVAGWANDAGMAGYIDMDYGRSLVFCNENCAKDQMTKKGRFRFRPKALAGKPEGVTA